MQLLATEDIKEICLIRKTMFSSQNPTFDSFALLSGASLLIEQIFTFLIVKTTTVYPFNYELQY